MRALFQVSLTAVLGLASCSPAEENASGGEDAASAEPRDSPTGKPAPDTFAGTAWRVMAEDGARYVTMLDEGGTYRDLRNGDPWQEGDWTYADGPGGKQLCLRPDHEDGLERCWEPERMKGNTMIATGPGDRRIELTRVDYAAPEKDEQSDEAE